MEMKGRSAFVLRLAGLSVLFEFLFLQAALLLTWNQPSWVGFFSNLFLASLFALALVFGSMLFGSGTVRRHGQDGSHAGWLALWLSTVVAFFGSMIFALVLMN